VPSGHIPSRCASVVAPPPTQRTRRCGRRSGVARRVTHASESFCSAADQAVGLSGAGPRRSRRFDGVATPGQEPRRSRVTSRQRVGCPGVAAQPCDVAPSKRGRSRLPQAVSSVELRSPCVRHTRRSFGEPAAIVARTFHRIFGIRQAADFFTPPCRSNSWACRINSFSSNERMPVSVC